MSNIFDPIDRVQFDMRTGRGQNNREHWAAAAKRARTERLTAAWQLKAGKVEMPLPPFAVRLTRIAPSDGLDDDNLRGALKHVRDGVADHFDIDDKRSDLLRYEYAQERGKWAVRIEVLP
jgi:hypothetical protein